MPNNETYYDNTKLTQYIKLSTNDSDFSAHVINELTNRDKIFSIIIDLKDASNDISIDFLIETLKHYGTIITIVNNKINGPLLSKINEISSRTLNYDELSFRDEKQKEDFEKDLVTNILNLPLERVDKLFEINPENYTNNMAKIFLDMIIKDYAEYLDENSVERLKDTIINLKAMDDKELIRTLFSSLINPAYSPKLGTTANEKIKESLIDIIVFDFSKKHGILSDYESKYSYYVIFLKEKLLSLGSKEDQTTFIFKGSIEQLINAVSTEPETFIDEINSIGTEKDSFNTLLHNIALTSNNPTKFEEYLLKLSSRADTKEEAIMIINRTIKEISELEPEISNKVVNISEYLNQSSLSLSA